MVGVGCNLTRASTDEFLMSETGLLMSKLRKPRVTPEPAVLGDWGVEGGGLVVGPVGFEPTATGVLAIVPRPAS